MVQVKIVSCINRYDCDDYLTQELTHSVTDWEEITDEELALLRANIGHVQARQNMTYVILTKPQHSVEPVLASVRQLIKGFEAQKKKMEDKRAEEEEKRAEAKRKRELKKLEELKAKYQEE